MAESKLYRDRNLQIIFGVTLVAVLAVSSITPAFPEIVQALDISYEAVGLLITAFTVPGVVLAPFLGVLADRFGRKRVLVSSLFLFGISGAACALTHNFNLILLLRVFQGIGGAGLGSLSLTIIGDMYPGQRLTGAMGLNASVLSIGTASYPAIGGALALLGWQYPFLLSLVAIPLGVIALTLLHNPEPRSKESLRNYLGGTWSYLKNIKVIGLFAASIVTFIILYGAYMTYFPLLIGHSFLASSLVIGMILSSMSISMTLVSVQLGRLTKICSEGTLIKAGFILYALALVLIPLLPNMWLLLVPAVIFGVGHGVNIPCIQTMVARLAPIEYRAGFMSINSSMLRLGQTLGPLLMGLLYVWWGFSGTFFAAAVLAMALPAMAIIAGRILGGNRKRKMGVTS